jgi:hypothetical protein
MNLSIVLSDSGLALEGISRAAKAAKIFDIIPAHPNKEIALKNFRSLFEQLKKNYPIQPGDKVRITTKVKNRSTGKAEPDNVQEGQCIELAVHYDDTIRLICYPYKANGEVSSKGKIWISHDTTVEKI